MGELLSALGVVGTVVGVWTLASVLAVFPVIRCFRLQAVANEAATNDERRQAWQAARHGVARH